jgi:flagellar hook-basal body complex protein FliE
MMSVTTNPISMMQPGESLLKSKAASGASQSGNVLNSAKATFSQALDSLSETQNNSDALLQKLAAGENVDLHQVMIAAEQTDISFRVAMAMRDRLVETYQDVMRMAV